MFLRFASTGGRSWSGLLKRRGIAQSREVFQFHVGGHKFIIPDADVQKYPSSLLYQMTQTSSSEEEIKINRSGSLFKHIHSFLLYGQLPRGANGNVMMNEQTLKELKAEADYYGLEQLAAECDLARRSSVGPDFISYFSVHAYILRVLVEHFERRRELSDFYISAVPTLSLALKCVWVPFCVADKLFRLCEKKFELNVADMVASPFLSAITDNHSQNSTLDVTKLNATVLDELVRELSGDSAFEQFAPHLNLTLHPKCLVVQKEGFSQEQSPVLQSTNDTGLIGKLVVILNSEYTGGELEVTHGGRTEVVTGPYSWVAMHGDCLHKINPVTSGTRVSLVCEIYGENREIREEDKWLLLNGHGLLNRFRAKPVDLVSTRRPLSAAQQLNILRCLAEEMKHRDSIVLGLLHQYHYNHLRQMPTVAMLRGGDKVLYEMLLSSGDYDITLVSATIHDTNGFIRNRPTVKLFSHDIMNSDTPECSTYDTIEDSDTDNDDKEPTHGTAVVLPSVIDRSWILSEDLVRDEYDGHRRESVYLVSGLVVSKKEK